MAQETLSTDSGAPAEDEVRVLALRVFDEMWNGKNLDVIPEIFSPDVVFLSPIQPDPIHGHAGVREFVERVLTGFPDFHAEITKQIVQGDTTAIAFEVRMTHTGPYLGLPPTGRFIHTTQIVMNTVRDGKIVRVHQEINALKKLDILGVLPPQAASPLVFLGWAFKTVGRIGYLTVKHQRAERRKAR